ncbi:MAG: AAA family ATPase [Deltaproteobacteria bacterium]|nr:AAA family ATPase [Deltaproteobacteria bacterium]
MIASVSIRNVQCLRRLEVPLRPLTVLVGNNDTGKSTFLRALWHLSTGTAPTRSFGAEPRQALVLEAALGGDRFPIAIGAAPPIPYRRVLVTQLPANGVQLVGQGFYDNQGVPELGANGSNVPALLDHFFRHDEPRWKDFKNALKAQVPGVQDVQIATPDPSTRRVDLVIENGQRMPADQASTGVRALIFYLALAYHPTPAPLILIEEPETGLHPKRLEDVMRLLRAIAEGQHGSPAQVVLSTHSPYLLDCVDLEKDQVLVFRRLPDGTRTAEPADTARLKVFLDEFKLGEVWFNRGEDGLVKEGV